MNTELIKKLSEELGVTVKFSHKNEDNCFITVEKRIDFPVELLVGNVEDLVKYIKKLI